MAVGKNTSWTIFSTLNKEKGKRYHLLYNIEAVGKNIKAGKGEGDGQFGIEDLKNWGGRISRCREHYIYLFLQKQGAVYNFSWEF